MSDDEEVLSAAKVHSRGLGALIAPHQPLGPPRMLQATASGLMHVPVTQLASSPQTLLILYSLASCSQPHAPGLHGNWERLDAHWTSEAS